MASLPESLLHGTSSDMTPAPDLGWGGRVQQWCAERRHGAAVERFVHLLWYIQDAAALVYPQVRYLITPLVWSPGPIVTTSAMASSRSSSRLHVLLLLVFPAKFN